MPTDIDRQISELIGPALSLLHPTLRSWVQAHLVVPRQIEAWADPERQIAALVWLVTDHTGQNDSSYRVVFDSSSQAFGLETTLADGTAWYMGPYGTFSDAIESM